MNYGYIMHFSPGELCFATAWEWIIKVGQQVLGRMTLSGKKKCELVRKDSGNTFVEGGTSHSGGLPLLSTPNRTSVYCSLQQEFFSPERGGGDQLRWNHKQHWGLGAGHTTQRVYLSTSALNVSTVTSNGRSRVLGYGAAWGASQSTEGYPCSPQGCLNPHIQPRADQKHLKTTLCLYVHCAFQSSHSLSDTVG